MRAFVIAISAIFLFSCGRGNEKDTNPAAQSQNHLRSGLEASNDFDDVTAEREFKKSLELDPENEKARTMLASIYAGRANIVLSKLAAPIFAIGSELEKRTLQNAKKKREGDFQKMADQLVSVDNEAIAKRLKAIFGEMEALVSGVGFFVSTANTFPTLSAEQMGSLDEAIRVLRERHPISIERSEESRMYLTILALARVLNISQRILISDATELVMLAQGDLDVFREHLCKFERAKLLPLVEEFKESLWLLKEGLAISPKEPLTGSRKGRARFRAYVTTLTDGDLLRNSKDFFNSETESGSSGNLLVTLYCKFGGGSLPFIVPFRISNAPAQ